MGQPSNARIALLQKMLKEKGIEKRAGIPRRADSTSDAPLSFGQLRLWFLDQYEPGTSLYNDALALSIRGVELDIERFRRAFDEVVDRHDVLRTSFPTVNGEPVQRLFPRASDEARALPFRVVDLRARPDAAAELEALQLEDVRGPFALDRLPLIRVTLARMGDTEYVFCLTMNHIVSDGVSYGIIYSELGAIYEALGAGRALELEPLPIQFADYAAWERATFDEATIARHLPYWKRKLGGELPRLAWPAKAATPRNRGAYHRFRFDDGLYEALCEYCRTEQVTSNWVLMGAYYALLHGFGGQVDVRVGTPSSSRKRPELEGLVGFFVQTVLLRVDLSGNPTFRELLTRVRQTALEAAAHEDVPFDRIVQAIRPRRDPDDVPLIQAWIAPMKDLMPTLELPGASSSYEIVDGKNARFELALILDEARGGVEAFFEYDVDLFAPETVRDIADRYVRTLRQAVEHPETTLRLLSETVAGGDTGKPAPKKRGRKLELKRRPRSAAPGKGGDATRPRTDHTEGRASEG